MRNMFLEYKLELIFVENVNYAISNIFIAYTRKFQPSFQASTVFRL